MNDALRDKLLKTPEWLGATIVVTVLYTALTWASFSLILPLQQAVLTNQQGFGILLFLPHGVRVMTAWLYGWRSIFYLIPGTLITHYMEFGADGFEASRALGLFTAITCGFAGIFAVQCIASRASFVSVEQIRWPGIIVAGLISSIINAVGNGYSLNLTNLWPLTYLIGDLTGTIVFLFVLLFVFRKMGWLYLK